MKTLISWVGFADFKDNEVSENSPNVNFHQTTQSKYDKHILLSTASDEKVGQEQEKIRVLKLRSLLDKTFRNKAGCQFDTRFLDIDDPWNLPIVYEKTASIIEEIISDDHKKTDKVHESGKSKIDIIFSSGTAIMSVAFYELYTRYPDKMSLWQGINPAYRIKGMPQFKQLERKIDVRGNIQIFDKEGGRTGKKNISDTTKPDSVKRVEKKIDRINELDSKTVLILGESGTGKELIARAIFSGSDRRRRGKNFFSVNCGQLSDTTLESRLFGHVKGAYTDAHEDTEGFFESANGGMLFLDEIGDISSKMQKSLLRAIQEQTISKVGSTKEIKVDVAVIAATNKNLHEEVEKSNFRSDLYFRLTMEGAVIETTPLRTLTIKQKRQIVNDQIKKTKDEFKTELGFSDDLMDFLLNYSYPGNFRQLIGIIKNIFFNIDENEIATISNIDRYLLYDSGTNESMKENLDEAEKEHIEKVYQQYENNASKTAKILGISRTTLNKKLKEYGIK